MVTLINEDCIKAMKEMKDNSVDSIVTDPPYELGFMGKSWDSTGIANNVEMWKECLRVLKPGGHLLAFSGTRTYHRMAVAIEDAGFEVRDMIEWVYGSGFPKSLNIGKAIDKLQGNEREIIGYDTFTAPDLRDVGAMSKEATGIDKLSFGQNLRPADRKQLEITKGTSEYEGWGTALKPAHEPICMARKPLAEKTIAQNVLKYGAGGINIDESRVGTEELLGRQASSTTMFGNGKMTKQDIIDNSNGLGRFPANLIHDNSEEVRACFPETKPAKKGIINPNGKTHGINSEVYGEYKPEPNTLQGHDDNGGNASRFFKSIIYNPKASKTERNTGCDKATSFHPTVKPIALMAYLIKMITPPNGTVLDPFMGSGSTGVACVENGFDFIGIDMTTEYFKIAQARIQHEQDKPKPIL